MIETDVLIIGAGMSGLTAAMQLKHSGYSVVCVEKARGSGGRLSSKRIGIEQGGISFDLGCTRFGASTQSFKDQVEEWIKQGVVSEWGSLVEPGGHCLSRQFVGTPRNSSITRHMSDQLGVHFSTRITRLKKQGNRWLSFCDIEGKDVPFASSKYIVLATPPQQSADLLPKTHEFTSLLTEVNMLPQWTMMVAVKGTLSLKGDISCKHSSALNNLSLESSKPGRSGIEGVEVWQLQASPEWSLLEIDRKKEYIAGELLCELEKIATKPINHIAHHVHRWLYARPDIQLDSQPDTKLQKTNGYLLSDDGIGICGDYLASGLSVIGVESAFLSGRSLAINIVNSSK